MRIIVARGVDVGVEAAVRREAVHGGNLGT